MSKIFTENDTRRRRMLVALRYILKLETNPEYFVPIKPWRAMVIGECNRLTLIYHTLQVHHIDPHDLAIAEAIVARSTEEHTCALERMVENEG